MYILLTLTDITSHVYFLYKMRFSVKVTNHPKVTHHISKKNYIGSTVTLKYVSWVGGKKYNNGLVTKQNGQYQTQSQILIAIEEGVAVVNAANSL